MDTIHKSNNKTSPGSKIDGSGEYKLQFTVIKDGDEYTNNPRLIKLEGGYFYADIEGIEKEINRMITSLNSEL